MLDLQTSLADAMTEAQKTLEENLRSLDEALRTPPEQDGAPLPERLAAVRANLAAHFRFEEESGYMETVQQREPRLDRAIKQLLAEHGRLMGMLASLLEESGLGRSASEPFRKKVRAWIDAVRDHESRENVLLEDAFNLDIGAED